MQMRGIYIEYAIILGLLGIISLLHYGTMHGHMSLHILHRELYFIPILLACIWFGLKMGLATSVTVSVLYAFHVLVPNRQGGDQWTVLSQIAVFNLIALIIGAMVDIRDRRNKELSFIKDTFGKYVTKEIRDEILKGRISLDGELKEVTVLFADLREFVKLVESTEPKEVVKIINEYFKQMTEAIEAQHGIVLQFVGDEIEAVFGAPLKSEHHRESAINAALEMRRKISRVNLKLVNQGYPPLRHGIGIHSGLVLAANIGSPDRLSYAMVGETVNIASRVQELNKQYGTDILVSGVTCEKLNVDMPLEKIAAVTIKGGQRQIDIYKLNKSYCLSNEMA